MDKQEAAPLRELGLIRQECFSLPIMFDHDHQIVDINDFAAEEAEPPLITHLATTATRDRAQAA